MESVAPTVAPRAHPVAPWPSEQPLRIFVIVVSIAIWLMLALSIIGLIYVGLIALFLFFTHVAFITHVRGSAVRLGPEQFPELHARVVELARRSGLAEAPEAYLMESGGSLNAFATRLFRGRMIVLFSDLLEACGDDESARDMVIGHELGHLRAGHLDWITFTAPGMLVPFLGSAYSRAREYTCDRWGAFLCGDPAGAARGLAILAAGGQHGPKVNLRAFVAQRESLDTGWMTIGQWLSGYPPLSARVAAIEPATANVPWLPRNGPGRAVLILAAILMGPSLIIAGGFAIWMALFLPRLGPLAETPTYDLPTVEDSFSPPESPELAAIQARAEMADLAAVVVEHHRATGEWIEDDGRLAELWLEYRGDAAFPRDPFDGLSYGFSVVAEGELRLFSSGPDGDSGTADDITRSVVREGGAPVPETASTASP